MSDSGDLGQAHDAWLGYLRMQRLLETHLNRHLQREFGLSASDYEILMKLAEAPNARMRAFELVQATQWEKSRMSHHLSRMERRGLIDREACDARYPELVLTKRGQQLIAECAPRHDAYIREFFIDAMGADGVSAMALASEHVIAAIDEHMKHECAVEDAPKS